MALPLTPWLHSQLKDELDLGHSWLLEKNTAKARAKKPCADVDSKWRGLYHDNGSCIDIFGPVCSEHARVLVLETSPLTITDGLHATEAFLTPACLDDLRARYPHPTIAINTVWTVKKFTIRYTSYGPPRNKLRLILDALDFLDVHPAKLAPTHALNRSDDIASSLLHLHNARLQDDRRCLRLLPKEDDDDDADTMAGAHDPNQDASINTQMPFGTQLQRPADDITWLGINRLEPVLAGNTQRAELKPRSRNAADDQRQKLLSLLAPSKPPRPPRDSPDREGDGMNHAREANTESPSNHSTHKSPSNHSTHKSSPAHFKPSPPPSTLQPSPPPSTLQPSPPPSTLQPSPPPSTLQPCPPHPSRTDASQETPTPNISQETPTPNAGQETPTPNASQETHAPTCPWMKGLTLNRATTTVPPDQLYILNKPESFAKRPDLPVPNVPIKLFVEWSRMTDEKAALEGPTSSGSFHDSPSSASYPANSAPQPAEEDSDSEGEVATSLVSWKTSPSPAPPPLPSALPDPPHHHHHFPPSSPPAQLAALDSDDDMELETSVPRALGEDLLHAPLAHATSTPVVQVKETPHFRGKNGQQPVVMISHPSQDSDRHLHNSSSASVVRGTYRHLSSSLVEETRLDTLDKTTSQAQVATARQTELQDAQDMAMFDMFVRDPSPEMIHSQRTRDTLHPDALHVQARPNETPVSAQLPPKDSSSGEQTITEPAPAMPPAQPGSPHSRYPSDTSSLAKRKRQASPQHRRRGSRHKRPKHAFGGLPVKTLQRERKEQEMQKSTSADSRQGSVSNVSLQDDAGVGESDPQPAKVQDAGGMSPRHQSLYATPSPVARPAPAAAAVEPLDLDQSGRDAAGATAQPEPEPKTPTPQPEPAQFPASVSLQPEPVPPASVSLSEPVPPTSVSIPTPASGPSPAPTPHPTQHTPAAHEPALTVFEHFQAAYPEYKASIKHFTNQCKQMEELDRQDRMVPKWMWDDFIIRNRTDFATYAASCIDAGEEPVKYITFYKDTIRDAIYKKGIIGTRKVLLQALDELGVPPAVHAAQAHATPSPIAGTTPPRKRARKSLPFAAPPATQDPPRATLSRHSLPAPKPTTHNPHRHAATHKPSRLGTSLRFYAASTPSASPLETGSGNEYRDFLRRRLAQRSPQERNAGDTSAAVPVNPARVPQPTTKVDVLTWGDVL